jgi:transcriptional regulator with XRE-family HTH domain
MFSGMIPIPKLPPLGQKVRLARIHKGMSQVALAAATASSQTTIGRLEATGRIDPKLAERIAPVLGLDVRELLDDQ